ncbi:TRAP transporter substrate-binding protein [Marimonas arenosa]|uniref:TRAP transporter substrate-binding protein n=1 Tax=Marimonas arenosa TaxID=1795305 RepID=A0AAE3WEN3_9RHOB|nr:TRAP transporter substrate-binding protein [Marimonas arenosa]MDQ2091214.1 TRAP transporter substrate-binding protein [Marimonas arenosa]
MSYLKRISGAVVALALSLAAPASAQVKIALDGPKDLENVGTYVWAHTFGEHLAANGMAYEEFERGALGGEAEKLDQVSQGLLEVSLSDVKSAGTLDATMFGVMLPYFFTGVGQMDRALLDGGMLERINSATTAKGVRVLDIALIGAGAGIFNTKHPVTGVADMSDLRMRALDEVQIAIFKAWGSTGTIVAWDEVPNALQTGVADGYLNPPIVPLMFGHTSFIKHFTDANLVPSSRAVIASEDWYQGLSDDQRKIVGDAVVAARAANREWLGTQVAVLDKLRGAGVEVIELSDAARAEFRKASEPLYGLLPMPEGALDAWIAAKGE